MLVHSSPFGNSADFSALLNASAAKAAPRFSPIRFSKISPLSKKRFTGGSAFVLLLMAVLLLTALTPAAVRADDTPVLGLPAVGENVYFGSYESDYHSGPVLWRVMGTGNAGSGMLLLSEYLLVRIKFNPDNNAADANVWQKSAAQGWCGTFYSGSFTAAEQKAVIQTTKTDAAYQGRLVPYNESSLNGEYVFFLSAEEAESVYFPIKDNDSRKAYFEGDSFEEDYWWLRSPCAATYFSKATAGDVVAGYLNGMYVDENLGARPAFNLDLSSVLFSSLIPSESESPKQYKLTLKDSGLTITPGDVTRSGNVITVSYSISGTNTGNGTKAYVIVTDKAYTESGAAVLAYTKLAADRTFTLDSNWGTDYKVYLLAVNEGGEKKTDTASEPSEITIPKLDQTVTAPTAVSPLTYNKSAQELINAGSAEHGTMKYAVTEENTKPSADAYTYTNDSLPTGTDAKTYYVWYMSVGDDDYNDYIGTSPVSVKIAPADPDTPTGLKATYGQTLINVSLSSGWAWADSSESVGNAGTNKFKANYTSTDTNHNSKTNVELSVEVKQADNPAKITQTAEVVQGGNTIDLSGNVSDDAVGDVSYTIKSDESGCSLDGSKLISGENIGSCTVTVTIDGDSNYKGTSVDITVTIIEKTTAPITTTPEAAAGWTEDGDEHDLLSTAGASDGGTFWYKLNEGSWSSDAKSLTAKTAGTYTISYYIKGTGIYKDNGSESSPLGTLTVTVAEKGTPQITTEPAGAENLVANGSEQQLLTTTGAADGGIVMYSVNGGEWSSDAPTASEAGSYEIAYFIMGDKTHTNSGSAEKPLGTITVVIADEPMDLVVNFVFITGSSKRGVPIDIKETMLSPSVSIKDGNNTVSQTGSLDLTFSGGDKEASVTATFSKKLKDLAPGKYSVSVSGLPKTIEFRDLDGNPAKYKLSTKAEINKKDGDIVITVYLIFKDQSAPEEPVVVRDLPEDEIGSYAITADGTKEYLLFQTYDICMAWLGSDELCRGPERCYHK